MKQSRRYIENLDKIDRNQEYALDEAATLLIDFNKTKFDESIEMAFNLGVDPKHADQIVRGTVSLPNGIGKDIRILVFAKDDLAEEAKKAGADFVGAEDMIEKVQGGWTDVDVVIAQRSGDVRVLQNDRNALGMSDREDPLIIQFQGSGMNTKGLGATLHLTLDDGSVTTRWNTDGSGFQSSILSSIQFMIPIDRTPMQLEILWPNGTKQLYSEIPRSGTIVVQQLNPLEP